MAVAAVDTQPQNRDAEASVLGAVLVAPRYLGAVLTDARLAPEHFYLEKHQVLFRAIVLMYDRGDAVDELTVCAELERRGSLEDAGDRGYISTLPGAVPAAGNAVHYARIIVEEAEWRLRKEAGQAILEAVATRDKEQIAGAEEMLACDLVHSGDDYSPDALADVAWRLVDQGGAECFPWPFEKLNRKTAGGMRRGELILIGGHTSHGKSQFLDQLLETDHKRGHSVRLYMNEMALEERVARFLSRRTEIPYARIILGKLNDAEKKLIVRALNQGIPYGITYAPGWSADDIAHHIRRHRWDVAAVDILHLIDYEDERDLSRISATFARCARQANCALVCTVHLNEKRIQTATRPRPTLGDIRGSGSLKNDADVVCFVYREQDSVTAEPLEDGAIYFAKVRNGEVGGMRVRFNPARLRFELPDRTLA